jgi:predicted RNA binding protein YcfA (HicA-like mRNA interferase family)
VDFPSLKSKKLLALLKREPLSYEVKRQNGSHRRLESTNDFPTLSFSFHDKATVGPGAVEKVLTQDVGLSKADALLAIDGKLKRKK